MHVSGEAIRPIFRKADAEFFSESVNSAEKDISVDYKNIHEEESIIISGSTIAESVPNPNTTCVKTATFEAEKRKLTSDSETVDKAHCLPLSGGKPPYVEKIVNHLGLILMLPLIAELTANLNTGINASRQILSQFLLGALNMEQSKTISKDFFNIFFGGNALKIQALRTNVYNLSTLGLRTELGSANIKRFSTLTSKIFYYDPHTKKYTGMLKILIGYCGSLHQMGKILISDYIHSVEGKPCFAEHFDNMYDLRVRFHFTVKAFKKLYPSQMRDGFTWIIDRGIYGIDAMHHILKTGDHIITWEKDYKKDAWNSKINSSSFILRIPRNNSYDLKEYSCEYQYHQWNRISKFNRYIVRLTKKIGCKKKRTIEVSVLSSNQNISAQDAITYIFRRWLQENDFGYLIKHYGIDQIDSYKSDEYKDIEDNERKTDFMIKSREFRKHEKEKTHLKAKLRKALLEREKKIDSLEHRLDKKINTRRNNYIAMGNELTNENNQKKINSVIRKMKRHNDKTLEINKKAEQEKLDLKIYHDNMISKLKSDIADIEDNMSAAVRDESRLDALIEEKYFRIDTVAKSVLDMLRILARNAFYELLTEDFRPLYDNLRDDHVILRTLIKAPGRIKA
ncbi:MAG: hypothetical protein P9M03_02440 [Candidatus Theseobacter exili]|nr:hypothetical protein [Candidatus Theseobacter exili]